MAKAKISVALEEDVLARIRSAVEAGRDQSVSAFVERAAREQLAAEDGFDAVLTEMLAETGRTLTPEDQAAAPGTLSRGWTRDELYKRGQRVFEG
ncbi:ribbon-helix-helix protein, CopG family [Candidatus Poriferisodalis sp.]|uniref:ribbon-helix-helix protein, CopG family n=1 Tax=Candidatus Poriferisodalis sp. TaxID=3101277 RepID=UPI003C6F7721